MPKTNSPVRWPQEKNVGFLQCSTEMDCGPVFKAKLILDNSETWITVFQERVNVDLTRPISHLLCHRTTISRLREQPVGLKAWCYLQHKTKLMGRAGAKVLSL